MKISKIIIVMLLILSAFSGLNLISRNVAAANPVLSAYGVVPFNGDVGESQFLFWCTYTDADNDAPTTMQVARFASNTYYPIYNMLANNSGDTTYTDGKQYYYILYGSIFPLVGASIMRIRTTSNNSAIIAITAGTITQKIPPLLRNTGITPTNNTPENFVFYANYYSSWYYQPAYVSVWIDGTNYSMVKNETDTNPTGYGINYTFSINLTYGLHIYSFHTMIYSYSDHDRPSGNYWILIQNETTPINWYFIGIVGIIVSLIIIIGILSFVEIKKKKR